MSDYGYRLTNPKIRAVDDKIRRVVATKSPEQLEREKLEAERDRDVAQLLRINEGDARPVWRKP